MSMDDLISRADAVSAVENYYADHKYITRSRTTLSAICEDMKGTINALPSAQPMNDSLHRQDVLDEIENWAECGEDKFENAVKALFDRIENMPSEQRTGYWSVESADRYTGYGGAIVCSECGRDGGSTHWKYCPYCGARMVEDE